MEQIKPQFYFHVCDLAVGHHSDLSEFTWGKAGRVLSDKIEQREITDSTDSYRIPLEKSRANERAIYSETKKELAHSPRQVRAPSQPNFSATAESVLESGMSNSRLSINISGKVPLQHILALERSKSPVQSLSLPGSSLPSRLTLLPWTAQALALPLPPALSPGWQGTSPGCL